MKSLLCPLYLKFIEKEIYKHDLLSSVHENQDYLVFKCSVCCYNVEIEVHQILGTQLTFVLVTSDSSILFLFLFSFIKWYPENSSSWDNLFIDEFGFFLFYHYVCFIHLFSKLLLNAMLQKLFHLTCYHSNHQQVFLRIYAMLGGIPRYIERMRGSCRLEFHLN